MLSQRLRQSRKAKKLTQDELALKVNTKKTTISNYETGYSSPSNEMLSDLADTLGVTTDYLLGRTNNTEVFLKPEQRDFVDKLVLDDEELLKRPIYYAGRELTDVEKRRLIHLLRAAVDPDQK